MPDTRYWKQEKFAGLGPGGQAALGRSAVLVAGCGATGGHMATLLARAGVGRLRVVDRDVPELGNLHRQVLYDESDPGSGRTKAELAAERLRRMNSGIEVQGVTVEIGPDNILDLAGDADLIMDGTDNQETRYLLNDAAVKLGKPWIYSGVIGAAGNVMPIIPGRTPCLRCLFPRPAPPGVLPTCETAGIIGPTPALAAAIAVTEAIKILTGATDRIIDGLISFDLWSNTFQAVALRSGKDDRCPCCALGRFDFLS
ncbi:MAG: HesA/MoeB/ThiF family protein [Proteobacteria bacterium]|nr:HesA/MoeB/ThiF family protein [Pseudomonadota bacterium]